MADAMRKNEGKPQLGYYLSTAAYDVEPSEEFGGGETDEQLIGAGLSLFARGEIEAIQLIAGLKAIFGESVVAHFFTQACMGGAEKYVRGNYMKGAPISQYIDCAARHLYAIKYGDAEYTETFTNLKGEKVTRTFSHWHNLVWNLVLIYEVMYYAPERDDRLFHMGNFTGAEVARVEYTEPQTNLQGLFDEIEDAEYEDPFSDNRRYSGSRSFETAAKQAGVDAYRGSEGRNLCSDPDCSIGCFKKA